jgi:two-component system, sensor histidine kinase
MILVPAQNALPAPSGESLEDAIVRASLRIRAVQSLRTALFVAIALVVVDIALEGRVSLTRLHLWVGLMAATTAARAAVCRIIAPQLETAPMAKLRRFETLMWTTVLLNTATIGLSFWMVAGTGDLTVRLVLTLMSCFYAVGALVNASSHFTSFAVGTVLNLGQGVLFWLGAGHYNPMQLEVAFPFLGVGLLIIGFGRENSRTFRESMRMRRENAELVARLANENQLVERALKAAKDASESKSRLLAAASHDLRQPLHALTMFLGTLSFHVTTDDGKRYLRRIQDAAIVLEDQFNSLLDLSKFDAGAVEPDIKAFRLDKAAERLVDELRAEAAAKGVVISAQVIGAVAMSDPILIGRVLRNLLDNAVKYTMSGSVVLLIAEEATDFVIEVTDTGSGIPEDQQARIFDEYVQLDNPARQRRHGVGLGLAIVRRIDSLLHLRLALRSEIGRGSQFRFYLPKANAAEPVATQERTPVDITGFRSSATVWILDDDPMVIDALREQLSAWGANVVTYSRPSDLLRDLRSGTAAPRWILADDMLGAEMSGLEMAEEIAREFANCNVCFITGNTEPQRLQALRSSGFPVIVKPAKPESLISILQMRTVAA